MARESDPPLPAFAGHRGPVSGVAFDQSGEWLAVSGYGKSVRLIDVAHGVQLPERLIGHRDWVTGVAFDNRPGVPGDPEAGRRLASSSADGTARIKPGRCGRWKGLQKTEGCVERGWLSRSRGTGSEMVSTRNSMIDITAYTYDPAGPLTATVDIQGKATSYDGNKTSGRGLDRYGGLGRDSFSTVTNRTTPQLAGAR